MFPLGTFLVNMVGCLVIGYLMQLSESRGVLQSEGRLFVFVGLLGGFTTFSSFGMETFQLIRDGEFLFATLNAGGQVLVGLTLVWLGVVVGAINTWRISMLGSDGHVLRIFVGETDKHQGIPLYEWILRKAKEQGLSRRNRFARALPVLGRTAKFIRARS